MPQRHYIRFDDDDVDLVRTVVEANPTASAYDIGVIMIRDHAWNTKRGLSRSDHTGLKNRITRLCKNNNISLPREAPKIKKEARRLRPPIQHGARPRGGPKQTLGTLPSLQENR